MKKRKTTFNIENIGFDEKEYEEDLKKYRENFQHYSARNEKAYRAGKHLAIPDMLRECFELGEPPPRWVVRAAEDLVRIYAAPLKGDLVHFMRWYDVTLLRGQVKARTLRLTLPATYEETSKRLRRTIAKGGPDAVEKSYKLVKKAKKSGRFDRYCLSVFG
jgi:hypothetical protein